MDVIDRTIDKVMADIQIMRNSSERHIDEEPKHSCPVCNDTGWEEYEKDGYTFCRECKCGIRRRQIEENRMRFANLPSNFSKLRISSFDITAYNSPNCQNAARNAVKGINYYLNNFNVLKGQGKGLYIYSQTKGSGKTRMAVSLANELMDKGVQVKFATSLQILAEIKKSWDKNSEYQSESELINQLSTTEVLIIDDFDVEQGGKAWISERFYQIINSRYMDKKVTIYTSNSGIESLGYDDRIVNRIKERSFVLPFPEESVRDKIAKENMNELINAIRRQEG